MESQVVLLDRILTAMKEAGVGKGERIKALAFKTGYSESTAGKILSGHSPVSEKFITIFCGSFGIRKEYIEKGEEPVLDPERCRWVSEEEEKEYKMVAGLIRSKPVLLTGAGKLVRLDEGNRFRAVAWLTDLLNEQNKKGA